MRVLVVGVGVIGSFNAARSKEAGQEVTLLARGHRL
jgi:ketopantoate reductase